MLRKFFAGLKNVAGRVLGATGSVLRKVGETAIKYHQPISMVASGLLGSSDNPTLQKLGAGVALGSAYLTSKGIGKNYLQPPSPSPT